MDTLRFLDILGFLVGLIYLWLEYHASIWLWLASIVMPAIDLVLYYRAGLYADFGMAIYYCLAALYGWAVWMKTHPSTPVKGGSSLRTQEEVSSPSQEGRGGTITHFPSTLVMPALLALLAVWYVIYYVLTHYTNSTVPVTDAFTTALSVVALWALSRKYAEQWLLWLVVDTVCCWLYVRKGIPFKAAIYGLYTLFAVFGYRKWLRMMAASPA